MRTYGPFGDANINSSRLDYPHRTGRFFGEAGLHVDVVAVHG